MDETAAACLLLSVAEDERVRLLYGSGATSSLTSRLTELEGWRDKQGWSEQVESDDGGRDVLTAGRDLQ